MNESSLISALNVALSKFSAKAAIRYKKDGSWHDITYSELASSVRKCAALLSELGLNKGDRIALISENRPEWAFLFFGALSKGIIAVPLDIHSPAADVKNVVNDCEPKAVFISSKANLKSGELEGLPHTKNIIDIDSIGSRLEGIKEAAQDIPAASGDIAVLLYTSGTTAAPKGVMLTHDNLFSDFNAVFSLGIYGEKDRILAVLPLYHSYPLMATLIAPFLAGARVVYPADDWTETLADYIRKERITVFVGVPQIYNMINRRIRARLKGLNLVAKTFVYFLINFSWSVRKNLKINVARALLANFHNMFGSQFRFFVSGGAKLDEKTAQMLFKLGFTLLEGYGLTETSPVSTFNPPDKPVIGSAGKAIPGVKIEIVNKDPDGIGEVIIQGPNVMKGYYNKEEETKAVIRGGWFYSGDLGYLDREGYLFLTGRLKELIVLSSGKNVYPEETEREYLKNPFVKEMCILGVSKERSVATQDFLYAVVVPDFNLLSERGEMNVYEVIKNNFENISRFLPAHKHLMGFIVTNEPIPRTTLGKIKRYEVEKRYIDDIRERRTMRQKDAQGAAGEEVLKTAVASKVIKYLKDIFDIAGSISPDASIEIDLGIDSLGRAEILSAMERAFSISLPDQMVAANIFTVRDLISTVESAIAASPGQCAAKAGIASLQLDEFIKDPPPPDIMQRIQLGISVIDRMLLILFKVPIYLFFKVFYSLKVEGAGNIPRQGPYIICPTHVSFYDGFIVEAAMPFHCALKLFFIGFRRYFTAPVIRSLVKRGRIIPIDAKEITAAMQAAYYILNNGKGLCIFPEGERTFDGSVQRFKKGVGVVAKSVDVKIIPCVLEGAYSAWPRTSNFPKPGRITVRFGPAVSSKELLEQARAAGKKDEAEAISAAIRERVAALKKGF